MMIPKVFSDDIGTWRKWKEDVTKYFDESKEGIKKIMDDVCKSSEPITTQVLQAVSALM